MKVIILLHLINIRDHYFVLNTSCLDGEFLKGENKPSLLFSFAFIWLLREVLKKKCVPSFTNILDICVLPIYILSPCISWGPGICVIEFIWVLHLLQEVTLCQTSYSIISSLVDCFLILVIFFWCIKVLNFYVVTSINHILSDLFHQF